MDQEARRFLDDFAEALARQGGGGSRRRAKQAQQSSHRLIGHLQEIDDPAFADDIGYLEALNERLREVGANAPSLGPMIEKAKALSRLEGIMPSEVVDRARSLLEEAQSRGAARGSRSGAAGLPAPVTAFCSECDEQVVGHNQGSATRWPYVRSRIREHSTQKHGGDPPTLKQDLRSAFEELRDGADETKFDRYVVKVAG